VKNPLDLAFCRTGPLNCFLPIIEGKHPHRLPIPKPVDIGKPYVLPGIASFGPHSGMHKDHDLISGENELLRLTYRHCLSAA
jgi:hypothetical protein